jgi:hypothetical protein
MKSASTQIEVRTVTNESGGFLLPPYNYYQSDTPELYDLKHDPKEMQNLVNSAEHRGKLEELKAQLFAWHRPASRTQIQY